MLMFFEKKIFWAMGKMDPFLNTIKLELSDNNPSSAIWLKMRYTNTKWYLFTITRPHSLYVVPSGHQISQYPDLMGPLINNWNCFLLNRWINRAINEEIGREGICSGREKPDCKCEWARSTQFIYGTIPGFAGKAALFCLFI